MLNSQKKIQLACNFESKNNARLNFDVLDMVATPAESTICQEFNSSLAKEEATLKEGADRFKESRDIVATTKE